MGGVGKAGCIAKVSAGFLRNYLLPKGQASPLTEEVLLNLEKANREEQERKAESLNQARAIQTALATIGKFLIRKPVGEDNKILGSVTGSDVIAVIRKHTGQDLD